MKRELRQSQINQIYKYIELNGPKQSIYIGVDVGKEILDIGITIGNSNISLYLGTINNTANGFKQLEEIITNLIIKGVDENNIFFGTENTGIYGHDIMNYFDDRIPNTYILNSCLTCHARKYYAKSDFKTDSIDAIIIATTLRDLDDKGKLESTQNPFNKSNGLGFVRRSFSNERSSLRILFRRLATLRTEKSKLMTSINMNKERLFPEINGIFSIKHRATSEAILLNSFNRDEILSMDKEEFIEKYKRLATKGQSNKRVLDKVEEFYDKVTERGIKISRCKIDENLGINMDDFILQGIKFKLKYYELVVKEMETVTKQIGDILNKLENQGYYIPKFVGINSIEIGLILGELGYDIYQMTSKEFIGFVGWYPENYTSGGGHIVKQSKLSNKKGIIKKFVYIWMYGFQLHTPSFRLYKKLLLLMYGVGETSTTVNIKNRRKTEAKCGKKLLEIIHNGYRNKTTFNDTMFIKGTINPIIQTIKSKGLSDEIISQTIKEVYNTQPIPACIII